MKLNRIKLGTFAQSSNKMAVCDPCYDLTVDDEIRGELSGVKTGSWSAYVLKGEMGSWGNRVCELQVFHESMSSETEGSSIWMKASHFSVGVDSGQAGFFDYEKYPFGNLGKYGEEGSFYDEACNMTTSGSGAIGGGIVRGFGAVSRSGVGDGCYGCFVMRDEGDEIVAAKIIFMDSDEEEDELTESSV